MIHKLKQVFFIGLFVSCLGAYSNLHAQNYLTDGGENKVSTLGESIQDFVVPESADGKIFYIGAYGADGGARRVNEIDGSKRFIIDGGGGAFIAGEFKVGDGPNEIPAGSVIRMIIGRTAGTHTTQSVAGNGGGGGTAVLFKRPGASNAEFELLIVAGGGGGAFSDCCASTAEGRSAETGTSGSSGDSSDSSNEYDGGSNGEGGEGDPDELASAKAGAGGGAFSAGKAGCGDCNGGAGGGTNDPQGGRGGSNTGVNLTEPGGYGYGGGGQGSHVSGGGGGGYSGGGTNHAHYGSGGGGGSYINENYTDNAQLIARGSTEHPEHGSVIYFFSCPESLGSVEVNNVKDCDSPFSGSIKGSVLFCNGDTYKIKILRENGSRVYEADLTILTWESYNLRAGNYTIELYAFGADGTPLLRDSRDVTITGTGDITAPNALCKDVSLNINVDETTTISTTDVDDGSTDNCSIKSIKFVDPDDPNRYINELSFTIDDTGQNTRTLSVEDRLGNRANCDFTVFVDDYPIFPNGCDATVYLLNSGTRLFYPPAPDQLINRATDLITPDESLVYTWDQDLDRFYCEDINQINTLDITATDESGNQVTCTANITVLDTIPAEVRCKDLLVDLDENGVGTIDYLALFGVVTDNCLSRSEIIDAYSWNEDLLPLTVDCSHLGSHDITLHSTTDIYGVELPKCSASITVRDPIQPLISCRDTTFTISNETSTVFTQETLPINFVSDNCTDDTELRFDWTPHDNFRCEDIGTTLFWVEVNDRNGNSARCEFNVNILEPEIEESFSCRSNSVQLNASNNHSYTLQIGDFAPNITSFCGIPVPGTVAFSGDTDIYIDCEDIGEPHPVTLTFTPDDGSPAQTCITNVGISEISNPIFTCPSGIIDLEATYEDCGAYFEYDYTVTDNCPIDDLDITYEQGLPSGSVFPVGWNDVEISARDKSGNYNACNFIVRVAAPSTAPTLTCPDDYTVNIEEDACSVVIDTTAIFDQTCLVINDQNQGTAMGALFEVGTHTFGFRTRNRDTGLSNQCTFQVTVDKADKKPIAICKEDTTIVLTSKNMQVNPIAFDGGSYDNCYAITQRTLFNGRFAKWVFTCGDLGTREYKLRVTNSVGASSTCTTHVTFEPETPQCQDISIELDEAGTATLTPEAVFIADSYCTGTLTIDQTTFTCDDIGENLVTLTRSFSRNGEVFNHHCTATVNVVESAENPCPNDNGAKVNIKAVLQGAYNTTTRLMNANLRTLSDFPLSQGSYRIEVGVLNVTGNNAIVDWVNISLRDPLDNRAVVFTRPALLQADGDVVDMDGVSPIHFQPELNGTYYVVIDHRNHLGLMTATTQAFTNPSTEISIDFTSTDLSVYGGASRIELATGIWGCFAADADGSGTINASDRSMTWNDRNQSGYLNTDYNLDGMTNASDRSAAWNNRNKGGTLPD